MARRVIGASRLSQRTSGADINSNFKELYDLIGSGGGGNGTVGPQGPKGDTGAQGPQGPIGPKGDTGDQGSQGVAGPTGPQGPQGERGFTGSKGDTGAQGIQGVKGDAGAQGIQGVKGDKGDKGDTGPSGSSGGAFYLKTVADIATTNIPTSTTVIVVGGYEVEGDAPPCRYRKTVNSTEAAYPSARTDANNVKWIIHEDVLYPEFFGAKGNGNGYSSTNPNALIAAAAGADDAPAFRATDIYAEATGKSCQTMSGKIYRFGSHVTSKVGQKSVLVPGSRVRWRFRSDLIHDSYDSVSGAPMFIWTNGTKAAPVNDLEFIFEGGRLLHPDDAVAPNRTSGIPAKKGSICVHQAFNVKVLRVNKSGLAPTNFQVSIFNSSMVWVDGGSVGYPVAPFNGEAGDDGVHVIVTQTGNACRDIWINNVRARSGDDPLSITAELNAVDCIIERVFVENMSCETDKANLIKIHIVNDTANNGTDDSRGNTIQEVYIKTHAGTMHGNTAGVLATIHNDSRAKNNSVRRIYIDGLHADMGTLPKTTDTFGTLRGQSVRVVNCDEVHFINCKLIGQYNAMLMFSECNDCSFDGQLITDATNNSSVTLATGLTVTQIKSQGSLRRVTFSGTPDLSAVASQVSKWSGDIAVYVNDIKLPIITISGMTGAGHNGSFVIRAVDNTNKTVDIENYRSGTTDETATTATASIVSGHMPVVMLLDCTDTKVNARVKAPLSWAVAFSGGRKGINLRNEIILDIEDQTFGYGIFSVRSRLSRFGITARNCRSGSIGMYYAPSSNVSSQSPYNHYLDSDDFGALEDAQGGFARTVVSEYATDKFGRIRGRTPTLFKGQVTQKAGTKSLGVLLSAGPPAVYAGINANINVYGGAPRTAIDNTHLRLLPRSGGHGGIDTVVWDAGNARFNVDTITAPTADVIWDYVIAYPD